MEPSDLINKDVNIYFKERPGEPGVTHAWYKRRVLSSSSTGITIKYQDTEKDVESICIPISSISHLEVLK